MNSFRNALTKAAAAVVSAQLLLAAPAAALVSMAAETETAAETAGTTSSGITMSTDFPAIDIEAGDSISFDIDFSNAGSGELVQLSTSELPDGFEGYFQGDGSSVSAAYIKTGESSSFITYIISVPETAEDGTYEITLYADGETESASMTLYLTVSELDLGASTFETDYVDQEGSSGDSFSYDTTLTNNSLSEQTFDLTAEAPDGWYVTFTASDGSTRVTSVTVDGLSSTTVTIDVTTPETAEAGTYTIPITVVSESEVMSMELTVTVTGSYDISLTTQDSTVSFDVKTNKETSVVLEVSNNGNMDLTDVNLTADVPTDWTVEFSESTIETLSAGETVQVTAYVTPADTAISGDYVISMTAAAEETSYTVSFRVTAETQTVWGVVGVLIIIAILAALAYVFKKFGRH